MTGVGRHHVRWLFHSTAMVADYDLAVRNLATLVGLTVLEYGESTEPGIGRRGGMAWVGDNAIEIGQPIVEGAAARFVSRFGGGMHSVALQVEDLEATMAHLESQGVRIAARPLPEMCFTDPRDTGGVFLQWSTFELAVDPRFGGTAGPHRRHRCSRRRRTTPSSARWSTTPPPGPTGLPHSSAPPSPSSTPAPLPPSPWLACRWATAPSPSTGWTRRRTRALWGRTYERACTHLLALRVEDLGAAADGDGHAGVAAVRGPTPTSSCSDPAATGGVQVALTGSLLPGDPRL